MRSLKQNTTYIVSVSPQGTGSEQALTSRNNTKVIPTTQNPRKGFAMNKTTNYFCNCGVTPILYLSGIPSFFFTFRIGQTVRIFLAANHLTVLNPCGINHYQKLKYIARGPRESPDLTEVQGLTIIFVVNTSEFLFSKHRDDNNS